jgi:hypothetical protein
MFEVGKKKPEDYCGQCKKYYKKMLALQDQLKAALSVEAENQALASGQWKNPILGPTLAGLNKTYIGGASSLQNSLIKDGKKPLEQASVTTPLGPLSFNVTQEQIDTLKQAVLESFKDADDKEADDNARMSLMGNPRHAKTELFMILLSSTLIKGGRSRSPPPSQSCFSTAKITS